MNKHHSGPFFFRSLHFLLIVGLFFILGPLFQVSASSVGPKTSPVLAGTVKVTAEVAVSPQQKFLIAKNSSLILQNQGIRVGKPTKLHITLRGYQNQLKPFQDFSIKIVDADFGVLQSYLAKTDHTGTATLTFIPNALSQRGSFIQIDVFNDRYTTTQAITFSTQYIQNLPKLQNSSEKSLVLNPDNRVIFVFSTRGKTAMLTRGSYVFFTTKNTSSKGNPYLFAARDGPWTVTT